MSREHPAWFEGGREPCAYCLGVYQIEREVRCTACDGGLCLECSVTIRVTGELLCPDCSGTTTGREEP